MSLYGNLAESKTVKFNMVGSLDIDINTFRVNSDITDKIYACGPPIIGNIIVVNIITGIVH